MVKNTDVYINNIMTQLGAILSFGANIGCILVHYTKSGVSTYA
ncbi:putative membrane protein [Acinetobacter baumannii 756476]|uniref:Membrane protein n=1 Tax=Acinetobacter baumannii 1462234 TaxID=1310646 RepID=A0A9P2XK36_ACIBA|nr:putative membrane protein [Acinetobacter baumannii 1462234]KCY76929.1 putative membrane protein [Acinetobacter baumannii 756476]